METSPHLDLTGPSAKNSYGERRTGPAKIALADAYRAVFRGKPSDAQRDMVFVDLANFSNFYGVAPPNTSADERAYREGARSVFGRIASHIHMTDLEREALQKATRFEAMVDQLEGEL